MSNMITSQRQRTQRLLMHGDPTQMLTVVNAPRSAASNHLSSSSWHQRAGQLIVKRSSTRSAARGRNGAALACGDEEAARTTRYWQKFAREATRELLKDVNKPEDDDPAKYLLYSGRVGIEPKHPPKIPDDESVSTKLSLLTCSDGDQPSGGRHRRVQRRTLEPDTDGTTNWAEAVKDSCGGVLGRMLERDAGTLQAITNGVTAYNVLNKATRLFSDEEQTLLVRSAHSRGIGSTQKSCSTENVSWPCNGRRTPNVKEILQSSTQPKRTRMDPVMSSTSVPDVREDVLTSAERQTRPSSKPRSIFGSDVPGIGYPVGLTSVGRDVDGDHSRRMYAQIYSTVTALDRIAGFGDATTDLNVIPEERGRYTEADYSRVPRYPQNIRVAPQLVGVITSEVRRRVNRPRQYELKRQDLYRFDRMQPSLDRASRNLFIFNWLGQLDERDFLGLSPFPAASDDGSDAGVTHIVVTGSGRHSCMTSASDDASGCSDVVNPYDNDYDVDSNGPVVGSLSDRSL